MYKRSILIILGIIILGGIGYLIYLSIIAGSNNNLGQKTVLDPQNATYIIDGRAFTLKNGQSVIDIPSSSAKITTHYFGNEVVADFNYDGFDDAAFLLTQNSGGSGTFYYVAAILGAKNSYAGTNAILLGDRIAPQTTEFQNGAIVVNYADRKPGEPMTAIPSVGVSKYFEIVGDELRELQVSNPTSTPTTSIEYRNTQYRFAFALPLSWKGYAIVTSSWEGNTVDTTTSQKFTGPEIIIRHPLWTAKNPRQDIPIMIFTFAEWNLIQQEKLSLGAAPIGPSELGRNSQYVFALPARYNYAFQTGFEEVQQIIDGKPLSTF